MNVMIYLLRECLREPAGLLMCGVEDQNAVHGAVIKRPRIVEHTTLLKWPRQSAFPPLVLREMCG